MAQKGITPIEQDYSQWYLDIVEQAELAENSAVRGFMVIKPHGYAIWERFQAELDKMIKETGHVNAYFPLLIPKSFLTKEANHIEGFAPEAAVVTHHRLKTDATTGEFSVDPDSKLDEELVVRPTSETIIYDTFSRWINSYRDLPLLINQWANVVRWELRTRPFLRTAEFLWQEGHTAHATHDQAEAEAIKMLGVYQTFAEQFLAIPVIPGQKSESEKFAGGLRTYTIEAMMQDGKALQSGTSHNLGDNFAKAFEIKYLDKDEQTKYAWQTSWGLSTRMVGAMIMVHSDNKGLVIPPKIAPNKVVIVPIIKAEGNQVVTQAAQALKATLQQFNPILDERDFHTTGEKFFEWEKKGIPMRIEIGPKDVENNQVVVVRRDTGVKSFVKMEELVTFIQSELQTMHTDMYAKALAYQQAKTFEVTSYEELKKVVENGGFAIAHWDGTTETEAKIKEETKATIRCIPFNQPVQEGTCIYTGTKVNAKKVIFAKAY